MRPRIADRLARALAIDHKPTRWEVIERVVCAALEDAPPLTLAVSGSRYIHDEREVYAMLRRVYLLVSADTGAVGPIIDEVIQGGGAGVDQQVDGVLELWAMERARLLGVERAVKLESRPIVADWTGQGRAAGPRRNARLLDEAQVWAGLWDGRAVRCGTLDTAKQAQRRGWIGWAVPRGEGLPGAWLYAVSGELFEEVDHGG
jgi:hypothetical protein